MTSWSKRRNRIPLRRPTRFSLSLNPIAWLRVLRKWGTKGRAMVVHYR